MNARIECWAVAYLCEDGSPAGRMEYFKTRDGAERYAKRVFMNVGAKVRCFRLVETPYEPTPAAAVAPSREAQ